MHALLITALIASFALSATAIRCHQCNSHLDHDCVALRLNTPRAQLDQQYLEDCKPDPTMEHADGQAFCRKIITVLNVNQEQRIVRGCGWLKDEGRIHNVSCFDADNEGFTQRICACFSDGCNPAANLGSNIALLAGGVIYFSARWLSSVLPF